MIEDKAIFWKGFFGLMLVVIGAGIVGAILENIFPQAAFAPMFFIVPQIGLVKTNKDYKNGFLTACGLLLVIVIAVLVLYYKGLIA